MPPRDGNIILVQSVLFFALGFLCAAFLALMVAPAFWRRAVSLTRRRIEAAVPLTLSEIEADKDRVRAEFAMSTRRLEMTVKSLREKAAAQVVDINRGREELKELAAEHARKNQAFSELEARHGELAAELRRREEQSQQLSDRLAEVERAMEERALEFEKLARMYDEASFSSSNRQIELVAREAEVERLASDVSRLRDQHKEAERRQQEIAAEGRAAIDALKAEKKRTADLDKKLERMVATLADREDRLERRERELARLRERLKGSVDAESTLNAQLVQAQSERVKLESEHADLARRMSMLLSGAQGGDVKAGDMEAAGIQKAIAGLNADRERLEERLTALERENNRLKADRAAAEASKPEGWSDERRESALLRERMNDLAAEVVHLTAMLDGPDSPIARALGVPREPQRGQAGGIVSLADRVRALRKAASAR
jgi:chromosome segregation ATPase